MNKEERITLGAVFLVLLSIPAVADANSSWCWISETRPYDVLPWVAAATILIETLIICRYGQVERKFHTLILVLLANIVSFIVPYILNYSRCYIYKDDKSFGAVLEHWPAYTVGVCFLFLTLLIEVPIVYFDLKGHVSDNKNLRNMIILANVITTVMVAVAERILCPGRW